MKQKLKSTFVSFLTLVALVTLVACGSGGSSISSSTSSQVISGASITPESSSAADSTSKQPADVLPENSTFSAHFLDVGQADSALIECDGHYMLIDGGNAEDSDFLYTYLKNERIRNLDYVVCTHAHEDHVGGLAGALNYASAETALCPVTSYDSKAFSSFVTYLGDTSITVPSSGDSFSLGSASFAVYGPVSSSSEPNNTSIVLKITYGETSFLFTGDAERDEEQDILDAGYDLSATVLKVGHHGSDTSTTYPFLREIMPEYAVISCGVGNSYGHPAEDTLSRLRDADVKTYRTDMQGTIICTSDGKTVSFDTERNADADTLDLSTSDGKYGQTASSSGSSGTTTITPATPSNPDPAPETPDEPETPVSSDIDYILNTNTKKFHYPSCSSVDQMKESNKRAYTGTRDEVIGMGYDPCGRCHP